MQCKTKWNAKKVKFIANCSKNWVNMQAVPLVSNIFGKISAQPHTTLCIQFLDRENNDKNNRLPLGKQICFTIVWGCAEILPYFLSLSRSHQLEVQDQIKKNKCTFTLVKNDSNKCKTNSECRKVKFGANHNKNWSKSAKYESCTYSRQYFISPYQLEVQDQIKINKCIGILEKSD